MNNLLNNFSILKPKSLSSRAGILLLISLISTSWVHAQSQKDAPAPNTAKPKQYEIPGTQVLRITSSIVAGQEYELHIQLPRNYQDSKTTFPVIYLTDSQYFFPLLNGLIGGEYYDGFMPGVIVVGITWVGTDPVESYRLRDLTPTKIAQGGPSGNGPNFLAFIKKELIPFIESKYRTKNGDRTLMGASFGGLFTLYALFTETELFNRYVLTSPALGWDNEIISSYEKDYRAKTIELPARVYVAVGELEGKLVDDLERFVNHLKARNYKGLELQTRILGNMGHSATTAEGYTRGLQWIFARPSVELTAAVLEQYLGPYEMALPAVAKMAPIKFTIVKENGQLVVIAPNSPKVEFPKIILSAETETDFYVKGRYVFVHFSKSNGKVTGFQAELFDTTLTASKIP
jgi:predicted alpha/beta superfamily hydrolase